MGKGPRSNMLSKINTNRYGGIWIGIGLLIGLVIPAAVWLICHVLLAWLIGIGGIVLAAFLIVFLIEMHQDNGKVPYYEKHLKEQLPFDPDQQEAIIRCSVCTGERIAGFRNNDDGHFTEVMLIRTPEDEKRFMQIFGIDSVRTVY